MAHATTQREVEGFPSEQRATAAFRGALRRKCPPIQRVCSRPRLDHTTKNCYSSVSTSNPPDRISAEPGSRRRSK